MDTPVFRSRWLALAFVMLLAMGAAHLVGDEKSGGLISDTAERIVHQQSQQDGDPRNPWSVEPGKTVVTSNAELLRDTPAFRPIPDDAKGDDVVAPSETPAPGPAIHPDVLTGRPFVVVDGKIKFVD